MWWFTLEIGQQVTSLHTVSGKGDALQGTKKSVSCSGSKMDSMHNMLQPGFAAVGLEGSVGWERRA